MTKQAAPDESQRWLLLVHQLPSEPSKLRVRTWRRLQGVGAVLVKNSVYALPNTPESREHFEWIRGEVVSHGGEAVVFTADSVDDLAQDELEAGFVAARRADWVALAERATGWLQRLESEAEPAGDDELARELKALRDRAAQIDRIDYFDAPGKHAALEAVERLARAGGDGSAPSPEPVARMEASSYRGRRWLTRPRPGVDRMASAWLIRRFVDPDAEFVFGERIPSDDDTVPYDMYGVDFGHRGEACTFETLLEAFAIETPELARIARVVHDLDLHLDESLEPDASTIGRLIDGLRGALSDDTELLDRGMLLFEALYRSFRDESA